MRIHFDQKEMKKVLLFSLILLMSLFSSCNREDIVNNKNIKENIEGIWGLVHEERIITVDGVLFEDSKIDYNPFEPKSINDTKYKIVHAYENNYYVSSYSWDPRAAKWISLDKYYWTFKGEKMFRRYEGDYDEEDIPSWYYSISNDNLMFERTVERIEDDPLILSIKYGKKEPVTIVSSGKEIWKKMSGIE